MMGCYGCAVYVGTCVAQENNKKETTARFENVENVCSKNNNKISFLLLLLLLLVYSSAQRVVRRNSSIRLVLQKKKVIFLFAETLSNMMKAVLMMTASYIIFSSHSVTLPQKQTKENTQNTKTDRLIVVVFL